LNHNDVVGKNLKFQQNVAIH